MIDLALVPVALLLLPFAVEFVRQGVLFVWDLFAGEG